MFGDDVRSTGIPSEVWRYYMLHNRPEQSDTFFLWEDFQAKANRSPHTSALAHTAPLHTAAAALSSEWSPRLTSALRPLCPPAWCASLSCGVSELLNNLGNFCQRTLAFVKNTFAGVVPAYGSESVWTEEERQWMDGVSARKRRYVELMEAVHLKEALKEAMALSSDANVFLQRSQPWELQKSHPLQCRKVITLAVNVIALLAVLLHPFMPSFTDNLSRQLNYLVRPGDLDAEDDTSSSFKLVIQPGHCIGAPSPLFRKIEDAEIVDYRRRFGGVEARKKGADFPLHVVVARVQAVRDHREKPHSHFVLTLDVGGGVTRSVVVGLKAYATAEALQGRKVLALLNVKEVTLHGELSQALLLVSVKKKQSLLRLQEGREDEVAVGSPVLPLDCVGVARDVAVDWRVAEKKLPLETIEGGKVAFGGLPWRTAEGVDVEAEDRAQGAKIKAA